jgi:hypothetical protein
MIIRSLSLITKELLDHFFTSLLYSARMCSLTKRVLPEHLTRSVSILHVIKVWLVEH